MPAMVIHCAPGRIRWPIASPLGKNPRARVWLITTTRGAVSVSAALNTRPARNGASPNKIHTNAETATVNFSARQSIPGRATAGRAAGLSAMNRDRCGFVDRDAKRREVSTSALVVLPWQPTPARPASRVSLGHSAGWLAAQRPVRVVVGRSCGRFGHASDHRQGEDRRMAGEALLRQGSAVTVR